MKDLQGLKGEKMKTWNAPSGLTKGARGNLLLGKNSALNGQNMMCRDIDPNFDK